MPTWSPAGDRIAFSSSRTSRRDLYVKSADGAGDTIPLLSVPDSANYLMGWSADEKILLCWRRPLAQVNEGGDIFYLKQKEDRSGYEEVPFLQTPFEEILPSLSPDGGFAAYVSNESGRREVYIQAFPQGGGKRRVSINGGQAPRWRADGKRFVLPEAVEADTETPPAIRVVQNWYEESRDREQTKSLGTKHIGLVYG